MKATMDVYAHVYEDDYETETCSSSCSRKVGSARPSPSRKLRLVGVEAG
jgi:hypothetical protein